MYAKRIELMTLNELPLAILKASHDEDEGIVEMKIITKEASLFFNSSPNPDHNKDYIEMLLTFAGFLIDFAKYLKGLK